MFQKLKAIFAVSHERVVKVPVDSSKCLVEIQLGGKMHTFYQKSIFLDCLAESMKTSKLGDFFVYSGLTGSYVINLDHVEFISIAKEVTEVLNDDPPGYTVFLAGKNKPIVLGDLSPDQVSEDFLVQTQRFIMLGSHYFNRDEVALIVCKQLPYQQQVTL